MRTELDADLGWALGTVLRRHLKAAETAIAHLPGGRRGYEVLAAAGQDAFGTQLALAGRLGVDRTVLTYLLDGLESAGLVQRRPDPADRRARQVSVTETGTAVLADVDRRLRAVEGELLAPLDPADRATFRALLRQLAASCSGRC
jgi:DNA-binding MarR family transcriptional regulator